MITEVVEQEQKKEEPKKAVGVGALILIGLAIWLLTRKKEEGQGGEGVVTPSVSINELTPVMSPGVFGGSVDPGTSIKLRARIRNRSTKNGNYCSLLVQVNFYVYEGSFFPGHGTLLRSLTVQTTLPANTTADVTTSSFVTVPGTIDRRDVGVDVLYKGNKIASQEWDDVYYVKQTVSASVDVLSISWL